MASLALRLRRRPALPRTIRGTRGTFCPGEALGLPRGTGDRSDRCPRRPLPRGWGEQLKPALETASNRPRAAPGQSLTLSLVGTAGARSAGRRLTWQVGRAGGGKRRPAGALPTGVGGPRAKCRWRRRRLGWLWFPRPLGSTPPPPPLPAFPPGLPRCQARPRRGSSSSASLPGELPPATSAGARPDPAPARQPRAPPRSYLSAPGEPPAERARAEQTPPQPARRAPASAVPSLRCPAPRPPGTQSPQAGTLRNLSRTSPYPQPHAAPLPL